MPLRHIPFYLANILIHTSVYIFFVIYPFKSRFKYSIKKVMPGLITYALFTCVMILLTFEQEAPFPQYSIPAFIIWIAFSIICCMRFINGKPFESCFLIFTTFSIQNNVIMLAKLICSLDILPHIPVFEHATYLLTTVGVLILYLPVMWYIYINLFKKVIDTNVDFEYWKYLFILPASFLVILRLSGFDDAYSKGTHGIDSLLILVFMNIMSISAYIITLHLLLRTYESMTAISQAHLVEKQLTLQKGEYQRLVETVRKNARQRHDWRHHLLTVSGLVKNKNYDLLESYLSEYMTLHPHEDEAPVCGNMIVDIILRHFISRASEYNIEISTDVSLPDALSIPDLELCVVFGNLVENAVEACIMQKSGRRFIEVKSAVAGEQLFILVENSFSSRPQQAGDTFTSSKRSGGEGMGLSSVKSIAETGGGSFTTRIQNNIFTVYVLLNI